MTGIGSDGAVGSGVGGDEAVRSSSAAAPNRWWQWFLLYPTLAISLFTAAPKWVDSIMAAAHNVQNRSFTEAKIQSELWAKNLPCTAFPLNYVPTKSDVKLDATICDSGDIFVRATTNDRKSYFYWVPVDRVIGKEADKTSVFSTAQAAERPGSAVGITDAILHLGERRHNLLTRVQFGVICQRFVDPRHVMRRITTPQGCIDQIVDTYTGQVVGAYPAPCAPC